MTTTLRARFDGKVLVPEEPVDLPIGQELILSVEEPEGAPATSQVDLEERLERVRKSFGTIQSDHVLPDEAFERESFYREAL